RSNKPHAPQKTSLNLKNAKEQVDTHSRIVLTAIGAKSPNAKLESNYPELLLDNKTHVQSLQYTSIILQLEDVTVKQMINGEKRSLLKHIPVNVYKTIVEDTIIIQIDYIYIYTNLQEKTSIRIYPFHYLISDNFNNHFIIKPSKNTPQDLLDKLEIILTYYTSYYRVPMSNTQSYNDNTARTMDKASTKIESGSMAVSRGLVSGGKYFAKGAAKVGEMYRNNAKAYEGPEMTDDQRRELENPDSEANKSLSSSEKMVQGSSCVNRSIFGALSLAGSKASEAVRKSDWYKERKEEEQRQERLNGKDEKGEAGKKLGGSGVNALTNVLGGLQEGVLISARGVRDASVETTRHTKGDYEAEVSKKKWDAAGNCTLSIVNVLSVVSTTWITAALYAAAGVVSYDPDKAQNLIGAWWKAGWVAEKSDLLSGSRWCPRWMVLRNPTIALYSSPLDPPDKPICYHYLTKVKCAKPLPEQQSQRSHSFEVVSLCSSIYLSTLVPEVEWCNQTIPQPHPETEMTQWMNAIANLSKYAKCE
ncbi:hypothetical protein SAMD00019534_087410, partial [Acytostelium subglobosum LB1]|uniref:hypothetical protein n=1 Tax=Acytostelium subglobosum LB1 TaxID=1410327 RepID=UPI0006448313